METLIVYMCVHHFGVCVCVCVCVQVCVQVSARVCRYDQGLPAALQRNLPCGVVSAAITGGDHCRTTPP